jgi:hypothetical protein
VHKTIDAIPIFHFSLHAAHFASQYHPSKHALYGIIQHLYQDTQLHIVKGDDIFSKPLSFQL